MSQLEKIIESKQKDVKEKKELYPLKLLEKSIFFDSPAVPLSAYIRRSDLSGIIAEFKRKSPSRGVINEFASPQKVCLEFMRSGASALSVLTDTKFFGGGNRDLEIARKFNFCPILRKDFIIDEYQVYESRSIGADAILLIARALTAAQLKKFHSLARSLSMEVLFEVYDESCIEKLPAEAAIIGVNNRDLKNSRVDHMHCVELSEKLPGSVLKIAESGIDSPEKYMVMKKAGFDGFLIGDYFMRTANPGRTCEKFIKKIKEIEKQHTKPGKRKQTGKY